MPPGTRDQVLGLVTERLVGTHAELAEAHACGFAPRSGAAGFGHGASGGRTAIARVPMIELLAGVDPERALRAARESMSVAPLRDRAIAAALARLVHTDVDRAAREADALRDPEARNVAYLELTERPVAGGRLAAAADFADRTAGGEPRVRAQLAVAQAEYEARRTAAARERLACTLPLLEPTWRCEGLCVIPAREGSPPAEPRGMNRYLILDIVLLALRADLRDELVDWAASQPDAGTRAAAWIVVAEAMSQLRLGRLVAYPVS